MESGIIKLAIADDHRAVRQAFKNALSLQFNFSFILDADSGLHLLSQLDRLEPDVLLLDIKMPGMDGIETLKIVREKYPLIRILVLSAFYDEVYVTQCLEYGINGYLTKDLDIHEIGTAIKVASANEVYMTNLLSHSFLKSYAISYKKNVRQFLPQFSLEEIRILELMQAEVHIDEISGIMCQSRRSIELKRDKMKEKANTKTIGGLLLYAVRRKLIN